MDLNTIKKIIADCRTYNEFYTRTGISKLKAKRLVESNNINVSHFTPGIGRSTRSRKTIKYTKNCKACNVSFTTKYNKQAYCSHKCSNSHTPHNPPSHFRTICFKHHPKICIICGESRVVEVHHHDHNHKNNSPDNLVPLCSTHHRYVHSKHKHLVLKQIDDYVNNFKMR